MFVNTQHDYTPPSSATIGSSQNEVDALRLLIAQRRLYRRAKRWLGLRWVGMILIGIGAPVLSVLWPSLAVAGGAVAGAWIFLGRTALAFVQSKIARQAASVQEQFDFYVFGMPATSTRSTLPSLEHIADIAGPDETIRQTAEAERLVDWYPLNEGNAGAVTIAISQRANASYTDGLLRTTAIVWAVATTAWCLVLIVVSVVVGLSLGEFLLGVLFPVLPAFLDVAQYIVGVWRSASDRADLASAIEAKLVGDSSPEPSDLLVWQERLFELRKGSPEVPDTLYKLRWNRNERAMRSAADQLSRRAKGEK